MGAKTPEQINKVRPTVKCDECGRKFLNAAALKSHFKFLHILKPDGTKRVAHKRGETKPLGKKVVPVHMLKRVNPSPASKQEKKTEVTEKPPDLPGKPTTVSKKPEFECPVCEEKFPVYFTAFRHIQKNHCVDEKGDTVLPNSPRLVKPIRIEMCASCRTEIRSTETHNCPKQHPNRDQYLCLGCEQVFNGLVLFQHHVKGLHADGAQNYFFPTRDEFTSWKADLQEQTKIEYLRLNKQKTKETYHCSHHSVSDADVTKLCPSTVIVREYMKGIHACYYKEHHGHKVENFQKNKYEQYCISYYTRETEDLQLEAADDNDLYLQFKKMVTCIVYDATKVDVSTLKDLLGKALEMTTVLKHYQSEDRNTPLISKCLTDAQITRTLDSLKPIQGKRKLSLGAKETKKVEVKKVKKTPSIEKSLSSVENGITSRLRSSPAVTSKTPVLSKSVSFSKSVPEKIEEMPQKSTPKKKIEEPPQKSLPKQVDEVKLDITKDESAPQTPVSRSLIQSPSSFNDSYKNFVDQNFKCIKDPNTSTPTPKAVITDSKTTTTKPKTNLVDTNTSTPRPKTNVKIKKKEVVKTKIGQFKVKLVTSPKTLDATSPKDSSPKSPKVTKDSKVPVIPKIWKAKEIRYEVKEQENDCNILILKI